VILLGLALISWMWVAGLVAGRDCEDECHGPAVLAGVTSVLIPLAAAAITGSVGASQRNGEEVAPAWMRGLRILRLLVILFGVAALVPGVRVMISATSAGGTVFGGLLVGLGVFSFWNAIEITKLVRVRRGDT